MDQIRQWFPNYERDLERARRFWTGQSSDRYIISVTTGQHFYRQIFDDAEILRRAALHLEAQGSLPGVNLPTFFVDWGTISTAKYWGGTPRFDSTGGNIFIDPVAQTLDEALALDPCPVDAPEMDGAHGLRLYREISRQLSTDALWFRSPDMQGPLNTAGLVMNQENLMMDLYAQPAKVHAFLEKVTDFLIEHARYLQRESGGRLCGNLWPYTFLPADLGLSFTEDLMPLLSTKLYKQFGIPCLRRLADAFGGLHIHCCGDWGRHARNLAEADLPIRAMEFHYPVTKIEELEPLAGQVVLIPYVMLHKTDQFKSTVEYYRYLLEKHGQRHRFWFACTEETPEMLDFVREYQGAA